MSLFTAKSESRGISLPADMWAYARGRAEREGRSVSNWLQCLIEEDAYWNTESQAAQAAAKVREEQSDDPA